MFKNLIFLTYKFNIEKISVIFDEFCLLSNNSTILDGILLMYLAKSIIQAIVLFVTKQLIQRIIIFQDELLYFLRNLKARFNPQLVTSEKKRFYDILYLSDKAIFYLLHIFFFQHNCCKPIHLCGCFLNFAKRFFTCVSVVELWGLIATVPF